MKPKLVVDTNTFINTLGELRNLSGKYELFTTDSVLEEVKTKKLQTQISTFFPKLKGTDPSKKSLDMVTKFSKKTGDFVSLSKTDLEVLALTVDIIEQEGKLDMLLKAPKSAETFINGKVAKKVAPSDFNLEEEEGAVVVEEVVAENENQEAPEEELVAKEKGEEKEQGEEVGEGECEEVLVRCNDEEPEEGICEEEEEEEEPKVEGEQQPKAPEGAPLPTPSFNGWMTSRRLLDAGEGWVGPDSVSGVGAFTSDLPGEGEGAFGVYLSTSDFAMQNVGLQMKLPLLTLDEKLITRVKSYQLECDSCLMMTKKPDAVFCPGCGHPTLGKVTCEYLADGSVKFYRKARRTFNTRGVRFPIPQPKFGRNINMVLSQDDYDRPAVKQKLNQLRREKGARAFAEAFDDDSEIFKEIPIGYGKKNPNSNAFWKNRKR